MPCLLTRLLLCIVLFDLASVAAASSADEALLLALRGHDVVAMQAALAQGADVEVTDFDGYSALYLAVAAGDRPAVEVLLAAGARPAVEVRLAAGAKLGRGGPYGRSPLGQAVELGYTDIVRLLLDVTAGEIEHQTLTRLLGRAAYLDYPEIVDRLISDGADPDRSAERMIPPPLIAAAGHGSVGAVAVLLRRGADGDIVDHGGGTALSWASRGGHDAVVKLLLQHPGRDAVETVDERGNTPLEHAVVTGALLEPDYQLRQLQPQTVQLIQDLLAAGARLDTAGSPLGPPPLHAAARRGALSLVRLFLAKGAQIDRKWQGMTPLYLAAHSGQTDTVRLLLEHGADSGAGSGSGPGSVHRPLFTAAKEGYAEIVAMLLDAGAKLDSAGPSGVARLFGDAAEYADVLAVLLRRGADPAIRQDYLRGSPAGRRVRSKRPEIQALFTQADALQRFPLPLIPPALPKPGRADPGLFSAVAAGDLATLSAALAAGADANTRNENGETLLHSAASNGRRALLEPLLAAGGLVDARSALRYTPLHLAVRARQLEMAAALLAAGADPNASLHSRHTPLHLAVINGDLASVELLVERGAWLWARTKSGHNALELAHGAGSRALKAWLKAQGMTYTRLPEWQQ